MGLTQLDNIRQFFAPRPMWMNGLMLFCLYMTFIYMPFDMFYKPVAEDKEVWFGFMLTGWWAKATEPLHWLIYGFGAWGFHKMKPWMHPWAALYVVQIAIGMFVWSVLERDALIGGAIAGCVFLALAAAIFMAKERFNGGETAPPNSEEIINEE